MPATAEIPAEHAYPEALALLQEKWVLFIVDALLAGAGGFNDLARRLDGLNSATLAQRLKRLEQAGLVTRRVHGLMPPRTSYELTPRGAALRGVLDAVRDWAGEPGRPAPHPSPAPLPPEEALPCGTSPPGGASGTLRTAAEMQVDLRAGPPGAGRMAHGRMAHPGSGRANGHHADPPPQRLVEGEAADRGHRSGHPPGELPAGG